ncbi:hypothetical protein C7433_1041 [Pantoea sp. PNA 03-3]|nr:hypothetical protein C7433_1041 [Pantoea sp. PNA 03-3]
MNFNTCSLLRLDIFYVRRRGYQSCECPHRLSDKLLKSSATSGLTVCCEVAYITLSSFRVNLFFRSFSPAKTPGSFLLNTALRKPLCRVSGGAL